jgi:hypothetical protein
MFPFLPKDRLRFQLKPVGGGNTKSFFLPIPPPIQFVLFLISLPKDSLLVLAQSHGIQLGKSPACENLSAVIVNHVETGGCTSREGYSSYLAFSSI